MPEHTYEILKNNETDPTAIVVRMGGITTDFSIASLLTEQETYRRYLREGEGQLAYERSVMANVLEHHPKLKKLSPEDLFSASMYEAARAKEAALVEQIDKINVELEASVKTLTDATTALGIKVPSAAKRAKADLKIVMAPGLNDESNG